MKTNTSPSFRAIPSFDIPSKPPFFVIPGKRSATRNPPPQNSTPVMGALSPGRYSQDAFFYDPPPITLYKHCMKNLDSDILNEMTKRLVAEFNPEQIILFGSYAWGTPTTDSDVNLLVIVSESHERPLTRMRRALICIEGMGIAKDVVVRTRQEVEQYRSVYASLENRVMEAGKKVYGRH
jgi:predicted nucleotidyltransferase